MKKELQEKLYNDFPEIFKRRHLSKQETAMCYGISCGDGWFPLIYNLCSSIQTHIDYVNELYEKRKNQEEENKELEVTNSWGYEKHPQVSADQIKSKWDGLRFYLHSYKGVSPEVRTMINITERMSYNICRHCGISILKLENHKCEKREETWKL